MRLRSIGMSKTPVSKRLALFLLLFAATACLGLVAGGLATNLWEDYKRTEYLEVREKGTEAVLHQVKSLRVGDTLPDGILEDLNRKKIRLHDLIEGKTIIMFILPDCQGCEEQTNQLLQTITQPEARRRFISISSSNPRLLEEEFVGDRSGLIILYDHRSRYSDLFGVSTFPFNVFVGEGRIIESLVSGRLLPEEFRETAGQTR